MIFFSNKLSGLLLTGALLASVPAVSCEFCTKKFTEELKKNSVRQNSLVAKEILLAMNNQKPLPFALPETSGSSGGTKEEFLEIMSRDARLNIPATSYVPQNTPPTRKVSIILSEGEVYLGQGVMFKGFTTNGTIPGPTIIVEEGDIVEFEVVNKGTIPHGASVHAAYTQTSKYLGKIEAGQTKKMVFKVNTPGVYLYHCAPGGHAIPMHIIFEQYGMMVVKPKKKYKLEQILNKKPDVEIYLTQHEFYASGKDAIEGKPMYTTFNGKLFRYVEEPIKAKPGDYVRIHFLNAGPNLIATFHIVGIIWDFAYWQGHPDAMLAGGQTVLAGPSDSWTVEFRMPPDEGNYLMLSHAVGSTDRGAIGLLTCDKNAKTPLTILSDGPSYTETQLAEFKAKSIRTISPFEPGTHDVDAPVVYGPDVKEVTISIIGNSFWPKRVQVTPGTKIKWRNEEAFTYMEGEYAGLHNVVATEGPETWASSMLAHAETFEFTLNKTGSYKYMCTPHPYMKGEIEVVEPVTGPVAGSLFSNVMILLGGILLLLVIMIALLLGKKTGLIKA